jgi:hypothetical protein
MKPTTNTPLVNRMVDDLYRQLEPILRDKAKAIVLLTLIRAIATMLARSDDHTRDKIIEAIPITLRGTLDHFDQEHPRANGEATLRKPPARPS